MKRLGMFASVLSITLLLGCAAAEKKGTMMEDPEMDREHEEMMMEDGDGMMMEEKMMDDEIMDKGM